MQKQEEIWLPGLGYEDYYIVSNTGRVIVLDREFTILNRWGVSVTIKLERQELSLGGKTYKKVQFSKDGKRQHMLVHRVVATAFIPNPDGKKQVNHINGNKKDNRVENLEWATSYENIAHAYSTGLIDMQNIGKHRIGTLPKSSKNVLDTQTGIFYDSMRAVEGVFSMRAGSLKSHLFGSQKNTVRAKALAQRFLAEELK